MDLKERLYWLRVEAAQRKRVGESVELHNVKCEACYTNIPYYLGPKDGILCSRCMQGDGVGNHCTRLMPLAITRGTLNE